MDLSMSHCTSCAVLLVDRVGQGGMAVLSDSAATPALTIIVSGNPALSALCNLVRTEE